VCWQQTAGDAARGPLNLASEAGDEQPRCACDRRGGDDDEHAGNTAFDGEHRPATVGDYETDGDRGDHH
jgi:hypothetical protein